MALRRCVQTPFLFHINTLRHKSSSAQQVRNAKGKGKRFQEWAANELLSKFPSLQKEDIVSTPMGRNGPDLMLSREAFELLPYDFELKNSKQLTVWAGVKQVLNRYETHGRVPVLFVTNTRCFKNTLAVVPFGLWCQLHNRDDLPEMHPLTDPQSLGATAATILKDGESRLDRAKMQAKIMNPEVMAGAAAKLLSLHAESTHDVEVGLKDAFVRSKTSLIKVWTKSRLNIFAQFPKVAKNNASLTPMLLLAREEYPVFLAMPYSKFLDVVLDEVEDVVEQRS
eukprot:m.341202 g.341202  ORF g.341202 m.341202 type:complete len:282 (-) comp19912_c0_seq1:202-1047(-)